MNGWMNLMWTNQYNYSPLWLTSKGSVPEFVVVVGRNTNWIHVLTDLKQAGVGACRVHPANHSHVSDVFPASPLAGPTKDGLFPQTAKGQAVLQQVKDFMQQYVLPAQQVSAKSFNEDRGHFICSDRGFILTWEDLTDQFIRATWIS